MDRLGTVKPRTGVATISGTYTCTNGDFIEMYVDASQKAGRGSVLGFGFFFDVGTCDGEPHTWTVEVFPQNGKFRGGKTMTFALAFACGSFECADGYVEQTVQLRGKK